MADIRIYDHVYNAVRIQSSFSLDGNKVVRGIMNKMKIYVIRHGEADWNASGRWQGRVDIVLNENGRIQARQCAEKMRSHKTMAIVSSPLKRASETAQRVALRSQFRPAAETYTL